MRSYFQNFKTPIVYAGAIAIATTLLAGCGRSKTENTQASGDTTAMRDTVSTKGKLPKPNGPKPAWGQDLQPEMQVVLEKLATYNAAPIETLTADQARKNPTPTTAVKDLISENSIEVPAPQVDTMSKQIPVNGGTIKARIYTPKKSDATFPVIVYYHGGGWVIADIDTYDASASGLSEKAEAIVVSIEYRKGPEHKFPTAHNDAFAAYQWVLKNAASFKGDPKKVALAGESAGGNLAANVSIMARDQKIQMPLYQLLVYPVAGDDMNTESYQKYAEAKPLNKAMMGWFGKNFLPSPAKMSDPRIALVKANLKGLPPTTIITAEIDPLNNDGKMLADKLKDADVKVNYKNYNGVTHEFFGMAAIVPEAKDAQEYGAKDLKSALK